jgi:hypothetical protein
MNSREGVVGQYADRTFANRKRAVGRESNPYRAAGLSDRPFFAHRPEFRECDEMNTTVGPQSSAPAGNFG